MGVASTLLAAAVLAGPPVEVSTFAGSEHQGELTSLKDGQLTLTVEGEEQKFDLEDVLELRLETKRQPAGGQDPKVTLTDGSEITCPQVTSDDKTFHLESAGLGELEIPKEAVGSVRLKPSKNALEEDWDKLTERQENADMLVIPKGDLLDHIKGVVGPITDEKVQLFVAGQQHAVNREKVFGVVYGNREPPKNVAVSRAMLPNGDQAELKSLTWTGEAFEAEMVAGPNVTMSPEKLSSLDFSLGKVQYLSDIEPRNVELQVPLHPANEPIPEIERDYHSYRVNKNFSGEPLQLGKTLYARGLCIHSKTELTYRLSKEIRRFQAMMGIDNNVAQRGLGDVQVTIKADGKTLLETLVEAGDEPRKVDLDVTDVVTLQIIVDFAREYDSGEGDHLTLGDAKFIK